MNVINVYQSIIILKKWNYRNNNFPTIYASLHVWIFKKKKIHEFWYFREKKFSI